MNLFRNAVVLITGAASGIGHERARAFAARGARVVASDVDGSALEAARATLATEGADCLPRDCDAAIPESVAALAERVQRTVGPLDVLVNNAGIAFRGGFEETPIPQWRHRFDVNEIGMVQCIQAFLPAIQAAGGPRNIVNVASAAGFAPVPNPSAHSASNHASVCLSETLAQELDRLNVSALVVCPDTINTTILHVSATAPGISASQVQCLRNYYRVYGCHPSVVAEDIVRSVQSGSHYLVTGTRAKAGHVWMRIPRRPTRRLTIAGARKSGYLKPQRKVS